MDWKCCLAVLLVSIMWLSKSVLSEPDTSPNMDLEYDEYVFDPDYTLEFDKRGKPYGYGMRKGGKPMYGFGLGKRSPAQQPSRLRKYGRRLGFGLGKRSTSPEYDTNMEANYFPRMTYFQFDDSSDSAASDDKAVRKRGKCVIDCKLSYPSYSYALKKLREQQKIRGTLGKRGKAEPESSRLLRRYPIYTFGLGKRSENVEDVDADGEKEL
ncbi:allatostatins-like [Artemia franciscana]|uniref:Uncharacterized protein n=1 Tax=Artemia franciscana TaxID=6661 RepID=A0AA88HYR9_ARTSF|nr:hypothetical protein QYM36_006464 [Artemia franciscana]